MDNINFLRVCNELKCPTSQIKTTLKRETEIIKKQVMTIFHT